MKNLREAELKESFKQQLLDALNKIKNPYAEIIFKFSEEGSNYHFKDEKILYSCGDLTYKDVRLGNMENQYVIDIILNNMNYNCFSFIRSDYHHGAVKCQGFGEYYGEDTVTIIYHRFKEEK